MKVEVFCGWGEGPDVGINITYTGPEIAAGQPGFAAVDLTIQEARLIAEALKGAADQAERLDRELAAYFEGSNEDAGQPG